MIKNKIKLTLVLFFIIVLSACSSVGNDSKLDEINKKLDDIKVKTEEMDNREEEVDKKIEEMNDKIKEMDKKLEEINNNNKNVSLPIEEDNEKENDEEVTFLYENDTFRIESVEPSENISDKLIVKGQSRVFENQVNYSLEDGHYVLLDGYVTATSGGLDWGSFEIILDLNDVDPDFDYDRHGTLFIYEVSAKDGSFINTIPIPVTFNK